MNEGGGSETEGAVWLKHLTLRTFRNYESLDVELEPGLTLVVGPNGHGKTNFIEAIYFLCLGRSFREHRHSRLIRFEAPAARVSGVAAWIGREREIQITLERAGRKRAELDGAPVARLSELIGVVPVVSLTPEDGALAFGEPMARRRFADVLLAQTDRLYLEALKRYRRALAQRNAALRSGRADMAEPYEEAMVESGDCIRESREGLVSFLEERAGAIYHRVGGGDEQFSVSYRSSPRSGGPEEGGEATTLGEALVARREVDLERGYTSVGPHRDDLLLEIDGRPLRLYGSHGQARTALVSLKLAELEYYAESYDRQPILLMDEVASVLDRLRAEELIGLLMEHSSQVVVTSPREEDLHSVVGRSHHLMRVEQGEVRI